MKKNIRKLLTIIITTILLTLTGSGCTKIPNVAELETFIYDFDDIIDSWDATEETARITPRFGLSTVILQLQERKHDLKDMEYPDCCDSLVALFDLVMEGYINAYQAFAGYSPDYIVSGYLILAESARESFDEQYEDFKNDPFQACFDALAETDKENF